MRLARRGFLGGTACLAAAAFAGPAFARGLASYPRPTDERLIDVPGGRAYVRFDHGSAPLASQWYEEVRRLFLSRFNA